MNINFLSDALVAELRQSCELEILITLVSAVPCKIKSGTVIPEMFPGMLEFDEVKSIPDSAIVTPLGL